MESACVFGGKAAISGNVFSYLHGYEEACTHKHMDGGERETWGETETEVCVWEREGGREYCNSSPSPLYQTASFITHRNNSWVHTIALRIKTHK